MIFSTSFAFPRQNKAAVPLPNDDTIDKISKLDWYHQNPKTVFAESSALINRKIPQLKDLTNGRYGSLRK